ncbi:extracellular solute-binding protein [Paenibacillus chondroitinus]|uniref:Extracellular solute-binding protein n=1 Tax=Paenibacillus chondroitinus TaxID=59842 RepID=A0ABU6DN51_9BACL|nr:MULTISPECIES: extracellular solute-binding protein [Paenibacillus]MCY9663114.1 extracellular solute-binding protein [Paenibacillus anseongense]MEB4799213.1 extracellular solute-binding protein [Paenibacillus chondroitinus]
MLRNSAFRSVKRYLVPLMLIGSTIAAMGCQSQSAGTASKPSDAAPGQTVLNVYSWTVEDSMKPFFEAFEKKYPNIKVKYTKMADSNPTTANSLLTSGEAIDVIPQASVDDMRVRATSGMYEPLDEYLKKDKMDYKQIFGDSINDLETVNGNHYALPYSMATYGLYYNKAMFDKAGVPYPTDDWTWDDLRAAALKLTSGSGANKIYGFLPDYTGQWAFPAIQQLGLNYVYKNNGQESNWDNPAFLNALQFFYDMEMKDKSAWPISEYKALKIDTNPHTIFMQGKAAMYIQPSFIVKYSSQESYGFTNFDYGVVNLPKVKKEDSLSNVYYISDFSIPASAPNKEAAWTFLKFYCLEAPEIFAQSKAMTPANLSSMDASVNEKVGKIIFDYPHFDQPTGMKTFISNKLKLTPYLTTITTAKAEMMDMVKSEITSCLMGNQTPAETIAKLKKQSDDLIKKAGK